MTETEPEYMDLEARGDTFQEVALKMAIDFWLRVREINYGPPPHPEKDIKETAAIFYCFLIDPSKKAI